MTCTCDGSGHLGCANRGAERVASAHGDRAWHVIVRGSLRVDRAQILGYRRAVQHLEERLPPGDASLRRAVRAGAQDSMPRAAITSLHARMEGIRPDALDHPSLVQVWGPRYSAYVVAKIDLAPFTIGRLPDSARGRRRAEETAARLATFLGGREMPEGEAGRGMGVHPNSLRYAAPTGTVLIRWDGARQSTVRSVVAPTMDPLQARLELARRYLHVFGPTTAHAFAVWAGISSPAGQAAFDALDASLLPVRTPLGDARMLAEDESALRANGSGASSSARLLPSGDPFYLLWGPDRELLVPDPSQRSALWTSRVWPGALLVAGELAGTWRRTQGTVVIDGWRRLSEQERAAVEAEAASMPLPGLKGPIEVRWAG